MRSGIHPDDVDLVLVNGVSVDFGYLLKDGDRVSVYPVFERFDISSITKVREKPLNIIRPKSRRRRGTSSLKNRPPII